MKNRYHIKYIKNNYFFEKVVIAEDYTLAIETLIAEEGIPQKDIRFIKLLK